MQYVVNGSICICLISALLYKYLVLDTSRPGALYLRERGCEVSWFFFFNEKKSANKRVWETLLSIME